MHSPFVFDFMMKVLFDKRHFYAYDEIEQIRILLKRDPRRLNIHDFGAGTKGVVKNERKLASITKRSAIPKKYGRLLFRLVKYYEPKTILELGSCVGIGTLYLAASSPGSNLHTIEGDPQLANITAQNIKRYSLPLENVHPYVGNFDDVLPEILDREEHVGLAYIDGNHRKEPTLNYFHQILPKCNESSILIFDDIYWSEEMAEAWAIIKDHPSVTVSLDFYRMGMVFFNKNRKENEHFKIYF